MEGSNGSSSTLRGESFYTLKDTPDVSTTVNPQIGRTEFSQGSVVAGPRKIQSEFISSNSGGDSTSRLDDLLGNGRTGDTSKIGHDNLHIGRHCTFKPLLLCEYRSCFFLKFKQVDSCIQCELISFKSRNHF